MWFEINIRHTHLSCWCNNLCSVGFFLWQLCFEFISVVVVYCFCGLLLLGSVCVPLRSFVPPVASALPQWRPFCTPSKVKTSAHGQVVAKTLIFGHTIHTPWVTRCRTPGIPLPLQYTSCHTFRQTDSSLHVCAILWDFGHLTIVYGLSDWIVQTLTVLACCSSKPPMLLARTTAGFKKRSSCSKMTTLHFSA